MLNAKQEKTFSELCEVIQANRENIVVTLPANVTFSLSRKAGESYNLLDFPMEKVVAMIYRSVPADHYVRVQRAAAHGGAIGTIHTKKDGTKWTSTAALKQKKVAEVIKQILACELPSRSVAVDPWLSALHDMLGRQKAKMTAKAIATEYDSIAKAEAALTAGNLERCRKAFEMVADVEVDVEDSDAAIITEILSRKRS